MMRSSANSDVLLPPISSRAQVSLEFVFFLGAGVVMLMAALVVIGHELSRASQEREYSLLQDFAYGLEQEFYFAAVAGDGFSRVVVLPELLDGVPYTVTLTHNQLTVASEHYDIAFIIPESTGTINHPGENLMMNVGGQVCVNACA